MLKVDWGDWGSALDVFMWQAISLTMNPPGEKYQKAGHISEWPPQLAIQAWIGDLAYEYSRRLKRSMHWFQGSVPVSLISPRPGDPSWRVVSMTEFGPWAASQGWDLPDGFPWATVGRDGKRPPQTQPEQERVLLATLRELHFDPLALPTPKRGRPGAKAAARTHIGKTSLFHSDEVFEKTWQRLRNAKQLKEV